MVIFPFHPADYPFPFCPGDYSVLTTITVSVPRRGKCTTASDELSEGEEGKRTTGMRFVTLCLTTLLRIYTVTVRP